ncbi:Vacuolar protein sorting-associated protein 25 [Tetrabaena socialis]|uniref:ESCRT-II complex subunit VPS25 n=1 Tax=Tetrabaena socialis TaxID=47790 RepID=A0A2J7ZSL9_9CHLO|nr:Vacuolar protein sorting-associated protein 25 [Tetrabaena socialis]|eukprot:PNH03248.1 Vacuolar protein sorting-associated protein 25 [Tetrabaena socialis]
MDGPRPPSQASGTGAKESSPQAQQQQQLLDLADAPMAGFIMILLQPVKETRDKQVSLWCSLILSYCQHTKSYVIDTQGDSPLFVNDSINRKLNSEARISFLDELVGQGRAEWLDKGKTQCLIFWKRVDEWAAVLMDFVKTYGLSQSVMTLDELTSGDDVRGTELFGLHHEILTRVLRFLEAQGKVRTFKGATPAELGVKFV